MRQTGASRCGYLDGSWREAGSVVCDDDDGGGDGGDDGDDGDDDGVGDDGEDDDDGEDLWMVVTDEKES